MIAAPWALAIARTIDRPSPCWELPGPVRARPSRRNGSNIVRKRGFPRFPDPTSQGQLSLSQIESAGINLEAPAAKPAALACASTSLGQISKADVERAIANPDASGSQSGSTQGRS